MRPSFRPTMTLCSTSKFSYRSAALKGKEWHFNGSRNASAYDTLYKTVHNNPRSETGMKSAVEEFFEFALLSTLLTVLLSPSLTFSLSAPLCVL